MDLSANRHRMMIKFLCFIEELASKRGRSGASVMESKSFIGNGFTVGSLVKPKYTCFITAPCRPTYPSWIFRYSLLWHRCNADRVLAGQHREEAQG